MHVARLPWQLPGIALVLVTAPLAEVHVANGAMLSLVQSPGSPV